MFETRFTLNFFMQNYQFVDTKLAICIDNFSHKINNFMTQNEQFSSTKLMIYLYRSNNFYYPVDISTTVFSYSRAVQYHAILHGTGVIARVLLHGPWGYAVS